MPSFYIHQKYGGKLCKELGLAISEYILRSIDKLIDDPDAEIRRLGIERIYNQLSQCDDTLATLFRYKYIYGLNVKTLFTHDWGLQSCKVLNTKYYELLKKFIGCLFGTYAEVFVDLHIVLDAICRCNFSLQDAIRWCKVNGISVAVIKFVKKYWDEILQDLL